MRFLIPMVAYIKANKVNENQFTTKHLEHKGKINLNASKYTVTPMDVFFLKTYNPTNSSVNKKKQFQQIINRVAYDAQRWKTMEFSKFKGNPGRIVGSVKAFQKNNNGGNKRRGTIAASINQIGHM